VLALNPTNGEVLWHTLLTPPNRNKATNDEDKGASATNSSTGGTEPFTRRKSDGGGGGGSSSSSIGSSKLERAPHLDPEWTIEALWADSPTALSRGLIGKLQGVGAGGSGVGGVGGGMSVYLSGVRESQGSPQPQRQARESHLVGGGGTAGVDLVAGEEMVDERTNQGIVEGPRRRRQIPPSPPSQYDYYSWKVAN
jgi:hypothetical protein